MEIDRMKIALDAGHGINTAGKRTPDGIREWTLNDRVLRGFYNEIIKYGVQTIRVDDATGKGDVPLVTRTNTAHNFGASVYISFHHNAYQSKWGEHGGSEVWIAKENARPLAQSMLDAILEVGGLRNRGVKLNPRNFHVTREFKGISMLCEIGFMDSNTDKFIREEKNSLAIGKQMAINFAKFYKLTDVKPTKTKYKVGDYVNFKQLSTQSNGGKVINASIKGGKITKVYEGAQYPYLIGNGLGFVNDRMITQPKPTPKPTPPTPNKPDQILYPGEKFIFNRVYRVDGMKKFNGVWAVYNKQLKAWITVGIVDKTDAKGKKTFNQVLYVGNYFVVPGTFTVEKVSGNTIYPKGWGFGVDAKTLFEV